MAIVSAPARVRPRTRLPFWALYGSALTIVLLGAAELFQRAIEPTPTAYFLFPPNTERTIHIPQDVVSGVGPVGHFVVNQYGLRGRVPRAEPRRLMVMGGSTVESLVQDEPNTWSAQLDRLINGFAGDRSTWVGNAGRAGITSFENIIEMRHLSDMVPNVGTVVMLIGANDLAIGYTNANRTAPEIVPEDVRYQRTFFVIQSLSEGFPYNLALYRLYLSIKRSSMLSQRGYLQVLGSDAQFREWIVNWRTDRAKSKPYRDDIPDLSQYLTGYRRNLEQIVDLAQQRGVDLILVTQPLMYRPDQSENEESIYHWFGRVDNHDEHHPAFYYSAGALFTMMGMYNHVTVEVCAERHILCIDAAARLKPNADNYFDGIHFTDAGNLAVAQIVFDGLKKAGKLPLAH